MKENDTTQLVDTVERYTRWQMKADEFQFMLIRFIIICMIWMLEKNALLLTSMNSGVDWGKFEHVSVIAYCCQTNEAIDLYNLSV